MSDDWLTIIPTDPQFVPSMDRGRAAEDAVVVLVPNAERVAVTTGDAIEFVDAGSNLQSIRCPRCQATVETDWWADRMSLAAASGFRDLIVEMPCCGSTGSLNDLTYDWPQGFARWRLEVFNPGRGLLENSEVEVVGSALGHDIRVIWTHV